MANRISIKEAFEQWESEIKPAVIRQYGQDDVPALSESWNDYTDSLCKDGQLTDLECHYCPAWDEPDMPDSDDTPGWILEKMGVRFDCAPVVSRPDSLMSDMPAGSRHYRVNMKRGDKIFTFHYSMGPAHTSGPDDADMFASLLLDSSGIECSCDFEDWCSDMGYDADSRRAERIYNACKEVAAQLSDMFTTSELSDLQDIFSDY